MCGAGPSGPRRPVLLHYQGNTSGGEKDLDHEVAAEVCDAVLGAGLVPIILDWDRRSPLPDGRRIHCPGAGDELWGGAGTGDAEVLAALIEQSTLVVGVDSGPLHVAGATATPAVGVWTSHHPVNYFDLANNVTHLVPEGHARLASGPAAVRYFEGHYRHRVYSRLGVELPALIRALLRGEDVGGVGNKLFLGELRSTSYGEGYYREHKLAGLDYLGFGDWQREYGRWLVGALGLGGRLVLDVGCACGSIVRGLAEAGAAAQGVDLSEHMVRLGREKWPDMAPLLHVCDAVNLHLFADGSWDAVHTAQVAEHWKPGAGAPHPAQSCAGGPAGGAVVLLPGHRGAVRPPGPAHGGGRPHARLRQAPGVVARAAARVRLAGVQRGTRRGPARAPGQLPEAVRLGLVRREEGGLMLTREEILGEPGTFDVREVYRPGDACAESIGWGDLRAIYQVKYLVARAVRPLRILEIGVRAGYSAAAFLAACPAARLVGLDKDDGSHGGVAGYLRDAREMLLGRYPEAGVELHALDSGDCERAGGWRGATQARSTWSTSTGTIPRPAAPGTSTGASRWCARAGTCWWTTTTRWRRCAVRRAPSRGRRGGSACTCPRPTATCCCEGRREGRGGDLQKVVLRPGIVFRPGSGGRAGLSNRYGRAHAADEEGVRGRGGRRSSRRPARTSKSRRDGAPARQQGRARAVSRTTRSRPGGLAWRGGPLARWGRSRTEPQEAWKRCPSTTPTSRNRTPTAPRTGAGNARAIFAKRANACPRAQTTGSRSRRWSTCTPSAPPGARSVPTEICRALTPPCTLPTAFMNTAARHAGSWKPSC